MKRLPRPLGATYLSKQLQSNPTKDNKIKLRKLILDAYIEQRLFITTSTDTTLIPIAQSLKSLSNKKQDNKRIKTQTTKKNNDTINYTAVEHITIEHMSIGLGISIVKCNELINRNIYKKAKKNIGQDGYQAMNEMVTRASQNRLILKALERYPTLTNWATELQAVARINGYHALQVKEANSALGNELSMMKTTFDMLGKMLPPAPSVAIQNNQVNNTQLPNTSEQGMMLTTTQAIQLLEEKGYTSQALNMEALSELHGLNDPNLPNIKALPQDAQGTKSFDVKELAYLNHENRRAEELSIVPNIDGKAIKAKPKKRTINI